MCTFILYFCFYCQMIWFLFMVLYSLLCGYFGFQRMNGLILAFHLYPSICLFVCMISVR